MPTDNRGLTITTESTRAAVLLSETIDAFAARQANTGGLLQSALEEDPNGCFANAVLGWMLHGARTTALTEQALSALNAAKITAPKATRREQQYVEALEYALHGQLIMAAKVLEAVVDEHPTDLAAIVFLQSELFWLGEMVWSERVSAKFIDHWNESIPGFPALLAIRAFDLEENNRFDQAENTAKRALALNPADVWSAHALAHVMLMQNRIDEGIEWMASKAPLWADANQMQYHLAWHECLFLIERRQHEQILSIYDERIRNRQHHLCAAMPDLYIDLQNASSLLWRLSQAGVDVGNRWQPLVDVIHPRMDDMSNPFTSAHFALILAANESYSDCESLIQSMESFSQNADHDLAGRYKRAAIPAAKAALAHHRQEHAHVIECLTPALNDLWEMGGSHAQQDIFFQLLAHSTAQIGDRKNHERLLHTIEKQGFVDAAARSVYQH